MQYRKTQSSDRDLVTFGLDSGDMGFMTRVQVSSPEDAALGLRERKKLRTQMELQDAALRLFAERGFDHVTADDIAAAVEVSKTTFYRYFESKEDVLLGDPAEGIAKMRNALAARPADEPVIDAVCNAVKDLAQQYAIDREKALLRRRLGQVTPSVAARNLERQAAWEQTVADFVLAREHDLPNPELMARVIAANIMATTRTTVEYWLDSDGTAPIADLIDDALAVFTVAVPKTGDARA